MGKQIWEKALKNLESAIPDPARNRFGICFLHPYLSANRKA
jgi:hypothetical protein